MSMFGDAVISECGSYRYQLRRRWDVGPTLGFVMLNPSTADALKDDPTIRRCIGFGKRWGFGALVVHNLFAFRAVHPKVLDVVEDPIGPDNDKYLSGSEADCTVVAWGANKVVQRHWPIGRINLVLSRDAICLGKTASGAPRHPLYVPHDVVPVRWTT